MITPLIYRVISLSRQIRPFDDGSANLAGRLTLEVRIIKRSQTPEEVSCGSSIAVGVEHHTISLKPRIVLHKTPII